MNVNHVHLRLFPFAILEEFVIFSMFMLQIIRIYVFNE